MILQPGHNDTIPLQITNNLPYPIVVYPETAIAQVVFFRTVAEATAPYSGQANAKYLGRLSDLRSRFYDDEIYSALRAVRPVTARINWDHILNVLLFLLVWASAASWLVARVASGAYSEAAKSVEVVIFVLTTVVGVVRGWRLVATWLA